MAVFTPLTRPELEAFVEPYGLGPLRDFKGIEGGVENSNFFISLEQRECVLTLIERGDPAALPFFIELLERLHQAKLPVPYAIPCRDGQALRQLAGKPALLQPRLSGSHVQTPNAQHCAEVGRMLARIHLATHDAIIEGRSDRGLAWMLSEGPRLAETLDPAQQALLNDSLQEIEQQRSAILALPQANLHADLFRDNVLFEGNHLSGVIDFYNACSGPMLYDLAITCNDWCCEADGQLDPARCRALLGAYVALRPCTTQEATLWPTMLRVACLRFWLSRLISAQQPQADGVKVKAPQEFAQRLRLRQQVTIALPMAL